MALDSVTENYKIYNKLTTKNIAVVVKIPGLDLLTNKTVVEKIRYGLPDLEYGDPVVYGGSRAIAGQRDLIAEQSALTISQKVEPEQGRGSISTLSLSFIDVDQYMTQAITPGVIIDEILGKTVEVFAAYEQLSYPDDYFRTFRGRITGVKAEPGLITLQFSDPNVKKNQKVFREAGSTLSAGISDSDTTIPVVSNSDFHKQILGPAGTYDPAIKTYLLLNDEVIEVPATGFGSNVFTGCIRGARGTTPAAAVLGDEVFSAVQIEDHLIDMSLKLMLSGFNGTWKDSEPIKNLGETGDPSLGVLPDAIIMPAGVDAVRDLGQSVGDYITVSGATNGGNNKTVVVQAFDDLFGRPNQIIRTDSTFITEVDSPALLAFRSEFDTYPTTCGVKLTPPEVDVDQYQFIKNTFLGTAAFSYRFYLTASERLKSFMEAEINLPVALYSLTRQGKISVNITKPPLADQRLQFLNEDNILNATKIAPQRAVNNRKFFNEIEFQYDLSDTDRFLTKRTDVDTDSLNVIGISQVLPIKSKGAKTDLGFGTIVESRSTFILNRYSNGALILTAVINWEVAGLIEAGDTVVLTDNGALQITNMQTGERDFGEQLLEVLDRKLDIKNGRGTFQLLTGIGAALDDRFAGVSPSSIVGVGSTTSRIIITESFGAIFPGNERGKYEDYVGLPIKVHNADFSIVEVVNLLPLPADNNDALDVSPALSFAPTAGFIVDLADYPTDADPNTNALYKLIHSFATPTADVVSGASSTVFDVSAGDALKFQIGLPILIHSLDFTIASPEVKVLSVVSTTITVDAPLGFTPAAGQKIQLIGFADGGQPYRLI